MTPSEIVVAAGAVGVLTVLPIVAIAMFMRQLRDLGFDGRRQVPVRVIHHHFAADASARVPGHIRTGLAHEPATLTVDEAWVEIGGSYPAWINRSEVTGLARLKPGVDGRTTVRFVTTNGRFDGVAFSTNDPEFDAKLARFGWPVS